MRPAGNFNPEWGYLAPVPGFMRTLRIALVAGTVGASAGAAVVFSLVDRPAAEESVASRTLVRATPAASIPVAVAPAPSASDAPAAPVSISAPLALANASNPSPAVNQSPAVNPSAAADERSASAPASHPANAAAALAESTPIGDTAPVQAAAPAVKVTATLPAYAPKKPAKRARVTPRYDSRGTFALLPYGGARAQGGDYYGLRSEY
jgi:hypothetical protein